MEKIYTKEEIRSMKRGPSLFPPIIVNFLSGRTMIFHDKEGGSVRITEDVTPEDSSYIWVRLEEHREAQPFTGGKTFDIPSSKGSSYTVILHSHNNSWTCSCPGFGFRRRCRHVDEAKLQLKNC